MVSALVDPTHRCGANWRELALAAFDLGDGAGGNSGADLDGIFSARLSEGGGEKYGTLIPRIFEENFCNVSIDFHLVNTQMEAD